MIRESVIQAKVVGYARSKGAIARKLDFGAGWPDYLFLHMGDVMFIEFKRPGEKPTALQLHVHDLLINHDFPVLVVDDVEKGYTMIDAFVGNTVVNSMDTKRRA